MHAPVWALTGLHLTSNDHPPPPPPPPPPRGAGRHIAKTQSSPMIIMPPNRHAAKTQSSPMRIMPPNSRSCQMTSTCETRGLSQADACPCVGSDGHASDRLARASCAGAYLALHAAQEAETPGAAAADGVSRSCCAEPPHVSQVGSKRLSLQKFQRDSRERKHMAGCRCSLSDTEYEVPSLRQSLQTHYVGKAVDVCTSWRRLLLERSSVAKRALAAALRMTQPTPEPTPIESFARLLSQYSGQPGGCR